MRINTAFLKSKHIARRFILLLAIVVLSVTSVAGVFTPVSADNSTISKFTGVAKGMTPEEQAQSYAYYKFMRQCFSYGYYSSRFTTPLPVPPFFLEFNNWISVEKGYSYDWFAQPANTGPIGSLQTAKLGMINNLRANVVNVTDDSQQDCFQDTFTKVMTAAAKLWGYEYGGQILCDIGFTQESSIGNDPKRCQGEGETGWRYETPSNVLSKIDTWYKDKIGFKSTSFDAIIPTGGAYMMYLRTFQIYCANKEPASSRAVASYPDIQVLEAPATEPTPTHYNVRDASHNAGSFANFYEGGGMNCGDLAKELQKEDSDAINGMHRWIQANKEDLDEGSSNNCSNPSYAETHVDQCNPFIEGGTSCNIPGIGWLICPALSFGADLADGFYKDILENFLSTNPSLVNSDPAAIDPNTGQKVGTGTFIAWGMMRNVANVAFVIAILIIVFSQMSSVGVSNYGVKKLLPRIIVAAILVNVSFYLCQIAVDLSNILGYTLKDTLAGVAQEVESQGGGSIPATTNESGHLGGILTIVITTTVIAWVNIGAIFVAIIGALVALGTIFILLIIRKVLIVLLIVVAPLAFVAFLLPNTEQYFHKWRKVFTSLLLLFPIIGLLYGGSILASTVLLQAVGNGPSDDPQVVLMKIAAYTALVVPLIAAIPLLRASLSAFGSIGSAIQNAGNKFGGMAKNKTQKTFDNSRLGQFRKFRQQKWDKRREAIQSGAYRGKNPLGALSALNRAANNSKLLNKVSGGFGADSELGAQGIMREDMKKTMEMFGGDDDLVKAWAATGGDMNHKDFKKYAKSDATKEQFMKMRAAGLHNKAASHLATAQYLSESGKGSMEMLASSLGHASTHGASSVETFNSWQSAQVAYRKNGRGDLVRAMDVHRTANGGNTPLGVDSLSKASAADVTKAQNEGWGEITPSTVHRETFDTAEGTDSYVNYLNSDPNHTAQALTGYDDMEGRAKDKAESLILAAAQKHQYDATGTTPTISTIQDAKEYFKIKG